MAELAIHPYTPDRAGAWDRFVMENAQNGTFQQTRRFLSYHPPERFQDASLIFARENGEIEAVVPAARREAEGKPLLKAHPGSTFGGLVLSKGITQAKQALEIVDALDTFAAARYAACELKITPQLMATAPTALLEYALFNRGYTQETEIACCLPLAGAERESLRAAYSATKRYELRRCESRGLVMKPLTTREELAAFYGLLLLNLRKFDATPVHTLAELEDFLFDRLKNEIRFLGVYDPSGAMVAGAGLFWFAQTRTLHTQYLATDTRVKAYAPSAFLYDAVIRTGFAMDAAWISFGTSTFEHGLVLNEGLIQNKEGFGCSHTLNRLFTKQY